MAKIGLKYVVAAPLQDDGETYGEGYVVGHAIKATVTANNNDVKLYADDGIAESDKSFNNGTLSLNVDDLTQKVYADMLGHTYTEAGTGSNATPELVTAAATDIAPYLGIGFYGEVRRNNKPSFVAKWLRKTQFSEPNDETDTKGETITFQTPTIEGTVFRADDGAWKEQAEFTTEAAARAWLNTKANISEAEGASVLAAKKTVSKETT